MSGITEQELLLLNNFMYMPGADSSAGQPLSYAIDSAIAQISSGTKPGGSMTRQEALNLLGEMKESDRIMGLIVAKTDNVVHAACFVDPASPGQATVAFQGTGGTYRAWKDNVQGAQDPDTDLQERALEFVTKDCAAYSGLTVTGHSKGGNLAMYVTVKAGDQVERCVSYDGQGFNKQFILDNEDAVLQATQKIKSICGDNDYVNGMLTSIAGETIYIKDAGSDFAGYHKSYDLYTAGTFEKGYFSSACITEQGPIGKLADRLTDSLVEATGLVLNEAEFKAVIGVLSSIVGTLFSLKKEPGAWMKDLSLIPDLIRSILGGFSLGFKLMAALAAALIACADLIAAAVDEIAHNSSMEKMPWKSKYLKDIVWVKRPGGGRGAFYSRGAERIVYRPDTLDACVHALKHLARGLENSASALSAASASCGSAAKCRVSAAKADLRLPGTRSLSAQGDLRQALQAYISMLQTYSSALGALSRRVAQADEMMDQADREIILITGRNR